MNVCMCVYVYVCMCMTLCITDLERHRGISARGRRIRVAALGGIGNESYTATLMTSLTNASGFVVSSLQVGGNNALKFLTLFWNLIWAGHLVPGDTLVLDNASIHY